MSQENRIALHGSAAAARSADADSHQPLTKRRNARRSLAERCHFSASLAIEEIFQSRTNRVYLLQDFEYRADGELRISAYAVSNPAAVVCLRFDRTTVTSIWQESYFRETMSWPLDIVRLRSESLPAGRFRFTLTCVDFEWTWESNWPQIV